MHALQFWQKKKKPGINVNILQFLNVYRYLSAFSGLVEMRLKYSWASESRTTGQQCAVGGKSRAASGKRAGGAGSSAAEDDATLAAEMLPRRREKRRPDLRAETTALIWPPQQQTKDDWTNQTWDWEDTYWIQLNNRPRNYKSRYSVRRKAQFCFKAAQMEDRKTTPRPLKIDELGHLCSWKSFVPNTYLLCLPQWQKKKKKKKKKPTENAKRAKSPPSSQGPTEKNKNKNKTKQKQKNWRNCLFCSFQVRNTVIIYFTLPPLSLHIWPWYQSPNVCIVTQLLFMRIETS